MSATLTSSPTNQRSAYRPHVFTVTRTDPSASQVTAVRPATVTDVTTYGNGLQEGDILVVHGLIQGPVPAAEGQTINLWQCDGYDGVFTILKVIDTNRLVIEAEDLGAVTPADGLARIYLDSYAFYLKLQVWTDPEGDAQEVIRRAEPDADGVATFDVAPMVRRFFSTDIAPLALPPAAGSITINAHGITALFYRVVIAELYDEPGQTEPADPFDPDAEWIFHDDNELDTEEAPFWRVAVNAIHPYHGDLVTWEDASMSDFAAVNNTSMVLTNAPRRQVVSSSDRFRLTMLTDVADEYLVGYVLSVRTVNANGTTSPLTTIPVEFDDTALESAAFAVCVGPADLAPFATLPEHYVVWLTDNGGTNRYSEQFFFRVQAPPVCESTRMMACLNLLGGVDHYTFTGREIQQEGTKRDSITKPYYDGTGNDWNEKVWRTRLATKCILSTSPIANTVKAWLGVSFLRSSNVVLVLSSTLITPVKLLTDGVNTRTTGPDFRPLTIEYMRGTDQLVQVQ